SNPIADLKIVKTNNQTQYTAGSDIVYVITIFNQGPSVAYDVAVSDMMPTGTNSMTWSNSLGQSGVGSLNQTIPQINVGQTVTYQVKLKVNENYKTNNLVNTVNVTSATSDPTPT